MTITTAASATPWLTRPKPKPQARLRLFCFPYAGGGAQIFHPWAERLPPMVEVCLLHLPGRGRRSQEPPFTQMAPLVAAAARALCPYLDRPFAFFGHSMGALVGFELARQLRRECGLEPIHFFASGCFAPEIPDPNPIHALPEPEFLEALRRLSGTSEELLENAELLQLMLPALRADCEVTETYVYADDAPLSCPITVYGGLQDPLVMRHHLEPWRRQTSASFSLQMLPGNHFFLHTEQWLLLQTISRSLHQIEVTMSAQGK